MCYSVYDKFLNFFNAELFGVFSRKLLRRKIRLYQRVKVLVLGGSEVGKTSLIQRIVGLPLADEYKPTIYDVYETEIFHENGQFTFEIIDTAGLYKFPEMQRLAISKSDIFLVLYTLDDISSIQEADRLAKEVSCVKGKNLDEIPFILVRNKIDVTSGTGSNLCHDATESVDDTKEHGLLQYFQISARSDINVDSLLEAIIAKSIYLNK